MGKNKDKRHGDSLSSRIKDIFIELHGYSFFHGPSEIRKVDQRFIGRTENINKLKTILTDSETRTGAYLVTGYRGMGKSSFVSKVIDEVDPSRPKPILKSIYRRIIAILVSLLFLDQAIYSNPEFSRIFFLNPIFIYLMAAVLLFSSVILVITDNLVDERKKWRCWWLWARMKTLAKNFFLIPNKMNSGSFFHRWVQIIFISFFIYACFFCIKFWLFPTENMLLQIIILFGIYIVIYLANYFVHESQNINFLKVLFKDIPHKIADYINYSKRLYIKFNLGYDDLKEIDILRLLARSVQREYEALKRKKFKFPNICLNLIKAWLILILAVLIYQSGPISKLNRDMKETIGLAKYFPSQENFKFYDQLENYRNCLGDKIKTDSLSLQYFTEYADSLIHIAFFWVKKNILGIPNGEPIVNCERYISIWDRVDYFFWLLFIVFYWLANFMISRFLKLPSRRKILLDLKHLNDMIDSQVTDEVESQAGVKTETAFAFSMLRKRRKAYPRADIREIEKRLVVILDEIAQDGPFSSRTELIFIFDELDKIEPNLNITVRQREEKTTKPDYQVENTFFATEGVRRRQQTIFKILSNLKYFLNTAKSKFIFIAGREMYDAALADVSDRNFFIGSIFHKVIYIPSFLTDTSGKGTSDVLSMTEQYVCQFLFPPFSKPKEYNLIEYTKYLKKFIFRDVKGVEPWINDARIKKTIFALRQFIVYLAYRSNGAPKKMTSFFESFIYKPEPGKYFRDSGLDDIDSLRVGLNSRNLYLKFDYHQQYAFEMITYLITPVLMTLKDAIKSYGDKLMVSTTFLIDHLYKFHKNAFSWRSIELAPEIIDINKAPQLRDLISRIIHNLTNSHLTDIVSGLYDMKFYKKISEEISFLSKVDEQEAAAFNFSLDESITLKRHYKNRLEDVKLHLKDREFQNKPDYINSISFLHMVIGDFHFYDEEYNDAILEYMEAVRGMRQLNLGHPDPSLIIIFIRNMLKLALTLEKRKSHYSASMIYGDLAARIVRFADIKPKIKELKPGHTNRKLMQKIFEKWNCGNSKNDPENQVERFLNELPELPFSPSKKELFYSISTFEGIRLMYQPMLARLYVMEKSYMGGIGREDLERLEDEFRFITRPINIKDKFLVEVEFWSKVGDLLYFKNSQSNCVSKVGTHNCSPGALCCGDKIKKKIEVPAGACSYYMRSLLILCREFLKIEEDITEKTFLPLIAYKLLKNKSPRKSMSHRVMARVLSAVGDSIYSSTSQPGPGDQEFFKRYFRFISNPEENFKEFFTHTMDERPMEQKLKDWESLDLNKFQKSMRSKKISEFNEIEEIFIYYHLSYRFYDRAGNKKLASVQFLKILYLIRNLVFLYKNESIPWIPDKGDFKEKIKDVLLKRGLRLLYRANGSVHRLEIEDLKNTFDKEIELGRLSLSTDLREYILVVEEILMACGEYPLNEKIGDFIHRHSITPYSPVNRMYNRIIELRFKAKIMYKAFERLCFKKLFALYAKRNDLSEVQKKTLGKRLVNIFEKPLRKGIIDDQIIKTNKSAFKFLLRDSIYCLHEIIKLASIYGASYMVNYSILADAHKKLGYWCKIFNLSRDEVPEIRKELENLLDSNDLEFLTPLFHYEKAMEAYNAIEELHKGGKTYRDFSDSMYYLNDDFNDTTYHFNAAGERYRINTKRIRDFRNDLIRKLKKSSIYEYDRYSGR